MADLNTILQTIQDALKAPTAAANVQSITIVAVVKLLTGETPIVTQYAGYEEISFSLAQQEKLRAIFEDMITGKPGPVRVKAGPVVYPVILSRLIPIVLAAAGIGFILGKKL